MNTESVPVQSEPISNYSCHWNEDGGLIMLVLVGLIASGKSTFAQALQDHLPQFLRCNQDDLGDRKTVERIARESLSAGTSVCIDRTNFDAWQRSHWMNIAKEFPRTKTWCLIFDAPLDTCRERLKHRTNHPTISSPEQGFRVLHQFQNAYSPPTADEGFDRIFRLRPTDHPSPHYTKEDLEAILTRISTSEPPKPEMAQRGVRDYFVSNSSRGRNSRDGWRGNRRGYSNHSASYGQSFNNRPVRGAYAQPNWRTRSPSASKSVSGSERSYSNQASSPDPVRNDGQGPCGGHNALQDNRLARHSERESQFPTRDSERYASSERPELDRGTVDLPIIID